LNANTTYHFAAYAYLQGQWTGAVIASATTQPVGDTTHTPNSIVIDMTWFDTATNEIVVEWHCDTFGTLYVYGSYVGLKSAIGTGPIPGPTKPIALRDTTNVTRIALGSQIVFDTTYLIALYMQKTTQDWSLLTATSIDSIRIPKAQWQDVRYFTPSDTMVPVFNGSVQLRLPPNTVWGSGVIDEKLRIFRPSPLPDGFIVASAGVLFTAVMGSEGFILSIKADTIPAGMASQLRMYRYAGPGQWLLCDAWSYDSITRRVSVSLLPGADAPTVLGYPFILMIDTQPPVAMVLTNAAGYIASDSSVTDSIAVTDNIANAQVTILYGRGGELLYGDTAFTLSGTTDTASKTIPSTYASVDNGLRIWVVVTDGVHRDTLNLSRQVRRPNSYELSSTAMQWVPFRVTAELDSTDVSRVLASFLDAGEAWQYDTKRFRLFRFFDCDKTSTQAANYKWLEYSDADKAYFTLAPGKLFWLKAKETTALDFGPGLTPSLRDTLVITVPPAAYTDFALPWMSFSMYIGDIVQSTGTVTDLLEFYHWKQSGTTFTAEPFYIPSIPPVAGLDLTNKAAALGSSALESGYMVYNPTTDTVRMRIPPTPMALSSIQAALPKRRTSADGWALTIRSHLADGTELNPVYLGYVNKPGDKTTLAVPPSFSKVTVAAFDRRLNKQSGLLLAHASYQGGFAYEVLFENTSAQSQDISYTIAGMENLPDSMSAVVMNPVDGAAQSGLEKLSVNLASGETQYRMIFVGGPGYRQQAVSGTTIWKFQLTGAYPNPFRNRMSIKFTLPYSGIGKVEALMYDPLGRRVWYHRLSGNLAGGMHEIAWNGRFANGSRLAGGLYILRLIAVDEQGKRIGIQQAKLFRIP
jgi:hypothetical protein